MITTMTWVQAELEADKLSNLHDMADIMAMTRLRYTLDDFEYMRVSGFKKKILEKPNKVLG